MVMQLWPIIARCCHKAVGARQRKKYSVNLGRPVAGRPFFVPCFMRHSLRNPLYATGYLPEHGQLTTTTAGKQSGHEQIAPVQMDLT